MASLKAKENKRQSSLYENSLPQGCQVIELSHISTNAYDSLRRGDGAETDNGGQYETVCVNTTGNNSSPQALNRNEESARQGTMLRSMDAHPGRMVIVAFVGVLVLTVVGLIISGVIVYNTLNAKIEEMENERQTQYAEDDTNNRLETLDNLVQELNNRSDMESVQLEINDVKAELSHIINGTNLRLNMLDSLVQELKNHTESSLANMKCTFDVDLCGWRQSDTDDFDWTRSHGTTPSSSTGPTSDHTSGNGYYYYTEASPRSPGDSAVLISPILPSDQDLCLQLYTNMYGNTMGQIDIRSKSCVGTYMLARYTTGDSSAIWRQRNIYIPAQTSLFTIQITGTRGSDFRSDAAIDDVTIKRGKC